jgi:hypothetical protein
VHGGLVTGLVVYYWWWTLVDVDGARTPHYFCTRAQLEP